MVRRFRENTRGGSKASQPRPPAGDPRLARESAVAKEQFPTYKPDFWYDLAKDALDRQLSFVDAVDTKLGTFLATGSAILAIMTAVYALKPDAVKGPQTVALAASVLLYGVLALVALRALMSHNWATGPDGEKLEALAVEHSYSDDQVRWKARARYVEDRKANENAYNLKVQALQIAVVDLVLLTAAVVIGLWILRP
jgi:hypothetical protein